MISFANTLTAIVARSSTAFSMTQQATTLCSFKSIAESDASPDCDRRKQISEHNIFSLALHYPELE